MINVISWLIVGATSSWLARLITDDHKALLRNSIIGSIGACSGGIAVNLFGQARLNVTMNDFSISSLLVALVCACALLGIVRLFRDSL